MSPGHGEALLLRSERSPVLVGILPAERKRDAKKTKGEIIIILAIDFDGVLCSNEFPAIGKPNYNMIRAIKKVIEAGHEVVLWTSRVETELENAVKWCEEHGLHFCAVNDAAPSNKNKYINLYDTMPRKVYADIYVDDHGIGYTEKSAVELLELIGGMKNEN